MAEESTEILTESDFLKHNQDSWDSNLMNDDPVQTNRLVAEKLNKSSISAISTSSKFQNLTAKHVLDLEFIECIKTDSEKCPNETDDNHVPIPALPWANNIEVWKVMTEQEKCSSHTKNAILYRSSSISMPRHRAELLQWLSDICYKLHLRRATYHLAIDYFDRVLVTHEVSTSSLQLVAISSLFIAAKFEEICPPKVNDLASECADACSCHDITECELTLLDILDWSVNPLTAIEWLSLYLQIYCYKKNQTNKKYNSSFLSPQYTGFQFVTACYLIDLFSLDLGYLFFKYNVIAASAMYFSYGESVALEVSQLTWSDIEDCVIYMAIFKDIITKSYDPQFQTVAQISIVEKPSYYKCSKTDSGNHHIIQNSIDIKYLEEAVTSRLCHMGFHVSPVYVIDNSENGDENTNEAVLLEEEQQNTELAIRMFKVERTSVEEKYETAALSSNSCSVDDPFTSQEIYSFDEVLIKTIELNKQMSFSHTAI